jgi:hypothetical protein
MSQALQRDHVVTLCINQYPIGSDSILACLEIGEQAMELAQLNRWNSHVYHSGL